MDDGQSLVPYGEMIKYVFGDWTLDEWRAAQEEMFRERLMSQPAWAEYYKQKALDMLREYVTLRKAS